MPSDRKWLTALMDLASAGDREAFGRLAAAAQDDLYRVALAQGLTQADAAETVQESLMRAYRLRSRWSAGRDALAWLYGIAMNVTRETRRRRQFPQRDGLDLDLLEQAPEADDAGPVDETHGLELKEALELLAERQREAVACRYLLRLSIRETAEAMGCAEGTVKAAVHAALLNLRRLMEKRP